MFSRIFIGASATQKVVYNFDLVIDVHFWVKHHAHHTSSCHLVLQIPIYRSSYLGVVVVCSTPPGMFVEYLSAGAFFEPVGLHSLILVSVGSITKQIERRGSCCWRTILGIVAGFIILCRRNGPAPTPKPNYVHH